jgi:hypothetical protein
VDEGARHVARPRGWAVGAGGAVPAPVLTPDGVCGRVSGVAAARGKGETLMGVWAVVRAPPSREHGDGCGLARRERERVENPGGLDSAGLLVVFS